MDEQNLMMILMILLPNVVHMARALRACDVKLPSVEPRA